ncbi:MAG: o-succinylbenzoate synthase [Propionibacteriaceae bacterium]|jgi:O-succinylbenzoate synthase|nr:o-succinylbenzoate synthase [Propionibacteriaceae bacterium]
MAILDQLSDFRVYSIEMRTRFRGVTTREGLLFRGPAGWAEWSPFAEYAYPEIGLWWDAALEMATEGFPPPLRQRIPVNVTVPAVDPGQAHQIVASSGCRTAKVKVAESGQNFSQDIERVEAVRDALGAGGKVRVDANGAWNVQEALTRLRRLNGFELEYAEQPCASVGELAELRLQLARRGANILVAADESIRRADDPQRVVDAEAADIAVVKVQPLGGVRKALALAQRLGLPVVVSSALETSVGLRAGLALAAALPELPYACGLNTSRLLVKDVVSTPLSAVDGELRLADVEVAEPEAWEAPSATRAKWERRLQGVLANIEAARKGG